MVSPNGMRILVATEAVDFRKGHSGSFAVSRAAISAELSSSGRGARYPRSHFQWRFPALLCMRQITVSFLMPFALGALVKVRFPSVTVGAFEFNVDHDS